MSECFQTQPQSGAEEEESRRRRRSPGGGGVQEESRRRRRSPGEGGSVALLLPLFADRGRAMAAVLLLLLTSSLFSWCGAEEALSRLPDSYRRGVDLALERLNAHAGIQHHFLFFKSVTKSQIEPGFDVTYIYHHFFFKATRCEKGTVQPAASCTFRNDRPLIDCAMCYKTFRGEIEQEPKPYVHCVHKPALTEDMKANRISHCNSLGYSSGAPTLLASTGSD